MKVYFFIARSGTIYLDPEDLEKKSLVDASLKLLISTEMYDFMHVYIRSELGLFYPHLSGYQADTLYPEGWTRPLGNIPPGSFQATPPLRLAHSQSLHRAY